MTLGKSQLEVTHLVPPVAHILEPEGVGKDDRTIEHPRCSPELFLRNLLQRPQPNMSHVDAPAPTYIQDTPTPRALSGSRDLNEHNRLQLLLWGEGDKLRYGDSFDCLVRKPMLTHNILKAKRQFSKNAQ